MTDDETRGTRPHFHVSNLLHGAVKDYADAHGIGRSDAYELSAMILIALDDEIPYDPRPDDPDVADLFDDIIQDCRD